MHLHTKVNHRKKRNVADKDGTSEEDESQNAAAQILAKSLPASALQEPPPAEHPAAAPILKKGPSANTLRQKGREYKPPAVKPAEKAAPRAKRGLTGSSSDAFA